MSTKNQVESATFITPNHNAGGGFLGRLGSIGGRTLFAAGLVVAAPEIFDIQTPDVAYAESWVGPYPCPEGWTLTGYVDVDNSGDPSPGDQVTCKSPPPTTPPTTSPPPTTVRRTTTTTSSSTTTTVTPSTSPDTSNPLGGIYGSVKATLPGEENIPVETSVVGVGPAPTAPNITPEQTSTSVESDASGSTKSGGNLGLGLGVLAAGAVVGGGIIALSRRPEKEEPETPRQESKKPVSSTPKSPKKRRRIAHA